LALNPGEGIENVTVNTPMMAVITPNMAEPEEFSTVGVVEHPLYPGIFINRTEWRDWRTWQVSVDYVEQESDLNFFSLYQFSKVAVDLVKE
jgi:hypothetical protein